MFEMSEREERRKRGRKRASYLQDPRRRSEGCRPSRRLEDEGVHGQDDDQRKASPDENGDEDEEDDDKDDDGNDDRDDDDAWSLFAAKRPAKALQRRRTLSTSVGLGCRSRSLCLSGRPHRPLSRR